MKEIKIMGLRAGFADRALPSLSSSSPILFSDFHPPFSLTLSLSLSHSLSRFDDSSSSHVVLPLSPSPPTSPSPLLDLDRAGFR